MPTITTEDRFWAKVDKTDSCWLWTAAKVRHGYGLFHWPQGDRQAQGTAHRYSWRLHRGEIPAEMFVLHRCDNPSCVNPDHLFLGTHRENMKDKMAKGRWNTGHGKRIAPDTVRLIRREVNNGTSRGAMARRLGVSATMVSEICSGKRWKNITDEIPTLPGLR